MAEVSWEDQTGSPNRASATLEDTSVSGACIRLKTPITIGSKIFVKWHREQFAAVARNCRSDGREFLLGVRRETTHLQTTPEINTSKPSDAANVTEPAAAAPLDLTPHSSPRAQDVPSKPEATQNQSAAPSSLSVPASATATYVRGAAPDGAHSRAIPSRSESASRALQIQSQRPPASGADAVPRARSSTTAVSSPEERNIMQSKGLFPKFWRRRQNGTDAPDQTRPTEVPVNKLHTHPAEAVTGPKGDLLSYEDIYHAAGILSPHSGYGIHKVVEMINSDRIRELSKEVKRASVLMALDAAGTSADDLLQDATRRQQALSAYEAGQQRQLEEYEARIGRENAQIQAEMQRVTAHYAERIQHNHDQVAREKETFRNWQMVKEHESQRIAEVIELCTRQPASAAPSDPPTQASGPITGVEPTHPAPARPGALTASTGQSR